MNDMISRKAAVDAIWDGTNYDIYTREVKEILEELPSAQPEQRWIPVSERLPDKPARYLVTNSRWGEFEVDWNIWTGSRWLYNGKPIAYMPLPTAYKGVDE